MRIFELSFATHLPRPLEEVFAFFSDARNLELLTPPWLRFRVLTPEPIAMKKGAVIDYALRLHGAPLRWRSEITAWEPPYRFIDEQRRGPYRMWVHKHTFREQNGGTIAEDRISYAVLGGRLVNKLFVARDLERVFAYRRRKLAEIFGNSSGP